MKKLNKKPTVESWSINLYWNNGKKEVWSDCDSFMDTQMVDDGITEYEESK